MAVGDRVMMFAGSQGGSTYAPDGPLLGTIVAEAAPNADVVWDNGLRTDDLVRDSVLLKVFIADDNDLTLFAHIAKFLQVADYPVVGLFEGATPKSPAAAGVAHEAFGVSGDFTDVDPLNAVVLMSWYDGRVRALVAAPSDRISAPQSALNQILVEQQGRRLVGKGP